REDLLRTLSDICSDCEGRGYTRSATTVVYDIFRDIRRIGRATGQQKIVVGANPRIVDLLLDPEHEGIEELEREYQHQILIKPDPLLHLEQYDIVVMGEGQGAPK
ncbi:MAG: Rne/Rng family ribonuclease, partial [Nitrospirales bacterium]